MEQVKKERPVKACPICGKVYKAQGIVSHIRLAHKKQEQEIAMDKMNLYKLIDELEMVMAKMKELEEKGKGSFLFFDYWENEDLHQVWKTLEARKNELLETIREIGEKINRVEKGKVEDPGEDKVVELPW